MMNKPENSKRLAWFAVLVFILASATIGYAAVPQSTVRTTGAGITTYVGNFVNATSGYYVGTTQVISATRAGNFAGVTGTSFIIGANTLTTAEWAFLDGTDQTLAQASSPTFNAITGTTFVIGADTLSTSEWGYLDGVDQSLAQANAVTFSSVDTGHGANDLYDMNQNVLTTSDVTFNDVTVSDELTLGGVARTTWPTVGDGSGVMLYDFLLLQNGVNTEVYNSTSYVYTEANFSKAANWVLANSSLTITDRRATIDFRGFFNLTGTIDQVGDRVILDGYGCTIEQTADTVACFQTADYGTDRSENCIIRGFRLDGNKPSRSTGSAIRGTWWDVQIYDCIIVAWSDYGIEFLSVDVTNRATGQIHHNQIGTGKSLEGNAGGGIKLGKAGYPTADCQIHHNQIINNGNWQIIIENGATHRIVENHFAAYADVGDPRCGGIYAGRWDDTSSADVDKIQVIGNHFEQNQLQSILVNATTGAFSDGWQVSSNDFYNCSNRYLNDTYPTVHFLSTTGRTRYGIIDGNHWKCEQGHYQPSYVIAIEGANSDYFLIDSNIREPNSSWIDLLDESGGTTVKGDNINIT